MSYLLDTCVVSEWMRRAPSAAVQAWLDARENLPMFLSVVTVGEIEQGISRLRDSARKKALSGWLRDEILPRFDGHLLDVGLEVAVRWGALRGEAIREGRTPPVIDSLLAATALVHDLIVVTRNTRDFEVLAAKVVNPWEDGS